jgi:hypothetical protein
MFSYICSYHQVSHELVDLLCSFGRRNDFSHARLIEEYATASASVPLSLPELGRSGREVKLAYKLSAMEVSDFDQKWTMRQTVMYHSLDLSNGRSFWITLKANDLIRDRILAASVTPSGPLSHVSNTLQDSLRAAFKTHLILLNWCAEGWRWHISSLESDARPTLGKLTAAPIPSDNETLDPIPTLVKTLSLSPNSRTFSTINPSRQNSASEGVGGPKATIPEKSEEARKAQVDQTVKRLNVLKDFSLKGLQKLNFTDSKVREAKMAMTMNLVILRQLREHYDTMFDAPDFPEDVVNACAGTYHMFKRQITLIETALQVECLRADTIMEQLANGKNLVCHKTSVFYQ